MANPSYTGRLLQKSAVIDTVLTKLAQGTYIGEMIADKVAPIVVVPSRFLRYIKWDAKAMRYKSSARAMLAKPRQLDIDYDVQGLTLPDGFTQKFGLDDRELEESASIASLSLDASKMSFTQDSMRIEREIRCATIATD